ncbi:MAG: heat shock protein HtpX [Motiliproteus sp.]|jgi:heat shock protein HtpX
MAGFVALFGYVLWGILGMLILLCSCALSILFIPSFSPQLMLRMYGARIIDPDQAPALWAIHSALSERANLAAIPSLYYIPSQVPNAFAMGSKQCSVIALSDALLQQLSLRELEGVIAHEISHIHNNDLWILGLADLFSRTTMLLSLMGQLLLIATLPLLLLSDLTINWLAVFLLIVAPLINLLAQQALSRTREFEADLSAARLTGDPEGLAQALMKIDAFETVWSARFFIPGQRTPGPSSLRSHPPTSKRVARLLRFRPMPAAPGGISLQPLDRDSGAKLGRDPAKTDVDRRRRPVNRPRRHLNGLWY